MSARLAERALRAVRRVARALPATATLRRRAMGAYNPATGLTAAPTVTTQAVDGATFSDERRLGADGLPVVARTAFLPAEALAAGIPVAIAPQEGDELVEAGGRVWTIGAITPLMIGGRLIGTRCELRATR